MAELKGNAIVGQSGGPTVVINESLVGIVQEAKKHSGIVKVYGARYGVKGILEDDLVDLSREGVRTLKQVARTPGAALGSVRKKPTEEECRKMFSVFKAHDVRYFFYIGGNDSAESASTINDLAQGQDYELRIFHVPKTIDNDLQVTDHCPGYGSAARFVAMALMGDDADNRSIPGIKVDVIMGRSAGFLTAAASLGRQSEDDGPHLVYVPERPFSVERFLGDVTKVYQRLGRCVAAVSEGIETAEGEPVYSSGEKDVFGNVQLSGSGALGDFLAGHVKKHFADVVGVENMRVRGDTFGYLQRSFPGIASETDAREARLAGEAAVKFAVGGDGGGSVAFRRLGDGDSYGVEPFVTGLSSVARKTKCMPDEFINSEGNDITEAFRCYALPLTGKLPVAGRLKMKKVRRAVKG